MNYNIKETVGSTTYTDEDLISAGLKVEIDKNNKDFYILVDDTSRNAILLAKQKNVLLDKIKQEYKSICSGIELITQKQIYVECEFENNKYKMNAGKNNARELFDATQFAIANNKTHLDFIRDINNINHPNIPIEEVKSINSQQNTDAEKYWVEKCIMVDLVNNSTSQENLDQIDIIFSVNLKD